ncbi:MAG: iron-sulfur cluster assembly protein [Chloroflexota bacterium]
MAESEKQEITREELEQKVVEQIKTVYDPEIPVNVYDLGLIYDVAITESLEVVVLMTLTAPNCPEAGALPTEVQDVIRAIPEVKDAKVLLTFDPPWDKSMLSEAAALELGLY